MKNGNKQGSRAVFINELAWRLFASLIGFALFYMLDRSVHMFIQWYVGNDASLTAARHPLHALGELSSLVCGMLAMTVVLVALIGIKRPSRSGGKEDAGR